MIKNQLTIFIFDLVYTIVPWNNEKYEIPKVRARIGMSRYFEKTGMIIGLNKEQDAMMEMIAMSWRQVRKEWMNGVEK